MIEYKKLIIQNIEYYYKVVSYEYGEYSGFVGYYTYFYTRETTKRKKYWLFGELVTKYEYNKVFEVNYDIEDLNISKEQNRINILKAYEKYVNEKIKINKRKLEIEKGELI